MGVISGIASALRLHIFDLQESRDVQPHEIVASWTRSHEWASLAISQNIEKPVGPIFMDAAATAYYESYIAHKPEIEDQWADVDIFIPRLILLKPADGDRVIRAAVWPNCIRMIFPEVDYVWIGRTKRKLFGLKTIKEQGLVEFEVVRRILGDDLERVEEPVLHYVCKLEIARPEVRQAIQELALISEQDYSIVDPSDIIAG